MKVLSLEAHSVMGVSDIRFDLSGHNLFLVGGTNGQGKTSALTAFTMALCGKSGSDYPEIALSKGESKGWVNVRLSGDSEELHEDNYLDVQLKMHRKRDGAVVEEFKILDSTGEEAPEPRKLLKRLYELRGFDPLAFERLDRKGKAAMIAKFTGLDFTEDKAKHKKLYDERTAVNREADKLQAQVDAMAFDRSAPDEEVSTGKLLEELDRRQQVNRENKKSRQDIFSRQELIKENRQQAQLLKTQIEQLQAKLAQLDRESDEQTVKLVSQQENISSLKDLDEDEIRGQMKNADAINAKVRSNAQRVKAAEKLAEVREASVELTEKMDAIAQAQATALKEAKFPVEGMQLDDEGVLFNGVPFEQASKSQRIMASVDVGMALNPKLRLLICQDGNDLDLDTLAALEAKARERDYQIIVEMVTRTKEDEDRCAVVIKGGEVVGAKKRTKKEPEPESEDVEI